MSNPLTVSVWPWVLLFVILLAGLLLLANWYEDHRLPQARTALDALAEDAQVAQLDDIWELPTFKEPA